MKLTPDCMRDILLTAESLDFDRGILFDDLRVMLQDYSAEELLYGCYKLREAGLIESTTFEIDGKVTPRTHEILDVTFSGHEFLEKIRDGKRWRIIKSGAASVRDFSLSALSAVAEGVTAAAISAYLSREKGHKEFFV